MQVQVPVPLCRGAAAGTTCPDCQQVHAEALTPLHTAHLVEGQANHSCWRAARLQTVKEFTRTLGHARTQGLPLGGLNECVALEKGKNHLPSMAGTNTRDPVTHMSKCTQLSIDSCSGEIEFKKDRYATRVCTAMGS